MHVIYDHTFSFFLLLISHLLDLELMVDDVYIILKCENI